MPDWHPATFHCLDVAAVALALVEQNPAWTARVASGIDCDPHALGRLFVRLVALHDIGKLTRGFCEMVGHDVPVQGGRGRPTSLRHWQASYQLLLDHLDADAAELLGVRKPGARRELYAAVAGHHGEPPARDPRFADLCGADAIRAFMSELSSLEGLRGEDEFDFREGDAKRLSWSLAGLTVVADWVGSNRLWFPFHSPEVSTDDYWAVARGRAAEALSAAALDRAQLSSEPATAVLAGFETVRPMQREVATVEIEPEPTLFVLEDSTGSGKTEAALVLARRLMQGGLAEGLYVALPTMATANAMYRRLSSACRSLFADGAPPSIALAHGRREQNDSFRDAVAEGLREASGSHGPRQDGPSGEAQVAAYCSAWVADNRKKTFLAEVGVGTIDQAFMAVLPVRFAVLRLFGLARRVLVVDEAHACDSYMTEELARLLEMQAMLGGSAIVMTATLTDELREKLVAAYRKGRVRSDAGGRQAISDRFVPTGRYPMLTVARGRGTCRVVDVPREVEMARTVSVERVKSVDDAVERLVGAAERGAACVWVRNTVDDAITAYGRLLARGLKVELFHARFAIGDRLRIERTVVDRFGADGADDERRGRVLVATQVVEASLDLDFDFMVTDLAPVDALIQRAGRLWRHPSRRPAGKRPVSGPTLHVLSADPDEVDGPKWGHDVAGGGGYVYGTPILWRSARVLFDEGEIRAPERLSALLEAVVGSDMPELPEPLQGRDLQIVGEDYAKACRARENAVVPANGYRESKPRSSEERFPTRADADGTIALLVRLVDGVPVPLLDGDVSRSEISLREGRLRALEEEAGVEPGDHVPAFAEGWPEWRRESLRMVEVGEDGSVGTEARYDAVKGLHRAEDASGRTEGEVDGRGTLHAKQVKTANPDRTVGGLCPHGERRGHEATGNDRMNLIGSRWIPVRRRSGAVDTVSPAGLLDDDPPVALLWPRADMNLACLELLVGLVYVADPPRDADDWRERAIEPDPTRLREALSALRPWFELDGDSGPRFMQELDGIDSDKALPLERLLIDAPGEKTVQDNADLFVWRQSELMVVSRPVAAMLLYTFQTFAPSGGAGNRTSMRGGGPMVTLVEPRSDATLFETVWANVPEGVPLPLDDEREIARAFPWTAPTPTSEKGKLKLGEHREHGDAPHWGCFFGMPRRVRLLFGDEPSDCAFGGGTDERPVTGFLQRPHGIDYGQWRHPTSPYYRIKPEAEPLPVHPKPGRFTYRSYEGTALRSSTGLRERALVVDRFAETRYTAGEETRLIVGGWAMDNMRALDFVFSRQPVPIGRLSEDAERRAVDATEAAALISSNLFAALQRALSIEASATDPASLARRTFYERTEGAFDEFLSALTASEDIEGSGSRLRSALVDTALDLFDGLTRPAISMAKPELARDTLAARRQITAAGLGYSPSGRRVFELLGLEAPKPKKSKKAAKKRTAKKPMGDGTS